MLHRIGEIMNEKIVAAIKALCELYTETDSIVAQKAIVEAITIVSEIEDYL